MIDMSLKINQLQLITIRLQANAIIERLHKVVIYNWYSKIIWFGKQSWKSRRQEDNPFDLITYFSQLHCYQDSRSTYHTTLQATPCQPVFGRNMIQILKRKQDIIDHYNQNESEEKIQITYENKVGDQVTPEILRKLSTPCTGPYPVTNVYKNGTIRIQKGIVSERLNILRITPFHQNSN
jgi:hypothetical protein